MPLNHCIVVWICENWVVPFFQTNAYTPWEFQDPKMEVLYHIKPDFWGVSPYKALRPDNMVGTSNKSVKWPLIYLLYPLYPMFSHDFPMIFPWFPYDFPMIFPWFPSVYPPNPLSLHRPRGPTQAQPVMVAGRLLLADRLLLPVVLAIPLWQRGDCDGLNAAGESSRNLGFAVWKNSMFFHVCSICSIFCWVFFWKVCWFLE